MFKSATLARNGMKYLLLIMSIGLVSVANAETYIVEVKIVTMGSNPQVELEKVFEMYPGYLKTI
jgi:hypothetical protein